MFIKNNLPRATLVAKTTNRGERVHWMRVRYWHQFLIGISYIILNHGDLIVLRHIHIIEIDHWVGRQTYIIDHPMTSYSYNRSSWMTSNSYHRSSWMKSYSYHRSSWMTSYSYHRSSWIKTYSYHRSSLMTSYSCGNDSTQ